MFGGIVSGLFFAWILTLFNADEIFIEAIQPFINFELLSAHWYIMFAVLGGIAGMFERV